MPELPEVETRRQYLEASSLYQPIEHILVEDHKLLTVDYETLLGKLVGCSFTGTRRVGKNLFVLTNKPDVILHLHFGMTGDLEYYHSSVGRPKYARIVFAFENGFNLGFICPRKFERVGLVDDIDTYLTRKKIAPDGLAISLPELTARVRRRKSPVKPVLLDQSVVAGLGNWIVDDVLFQAGIHPLTLASSLSDEAMHRLHEAIRHVLTVAIEHEAVYRNFPASFLIHAREWDHSPYEAPDAHRYCPVCQTPIQRTVVGGRTTLYCPVCQPE
ncbi:Fpg/Nei family DNA glycosylase [Arsenicibacter rosenii]|uniref:DNA-formamidopyrimidine glycosylase n=1 Tax=Arsenicibacter rosenii TaxID=1750698 RepID=A0A1S2VJ86_9BACT|nr:DNA-formamidopyrimidine glycosylase family protein [Arsenicibacter rosenii]OIN57888.1 DNA-formamidopyrimidine glycosylase [Arsenicibacter rosenii]